MGGSGCILVRHMLHTPPSLMYHSGKMFTVDIEIYPTFPVQILTKIHLSLHLSLAVEDKACNI